MKRNFLTGVVKYGIIKKIMNPKSINIAVAEQIEKFSSDKVISTVVEKLVQVEVNKRADTLHSAIKLSEDTFRELRKASKPDQVFVDGEGKRAESFTIKAYETKKKLEEKLAKIDTVVTNATEKGEWNKLYDLVKGGSNGGGAEEKTDESK